MSQELELQTAPCAICLEHFVKDTNYIITDCKHEFHSSCMLEYVYRNRFHNNCPTCRHELCKRLDTPDSYFVERLVNPRNIDITDINIDTINLSITINYLMLVIKIISLVALTLWIIYTIKPSIIDIMIKTTLIYYAPKILDTLLDITKCLIITSITFVAFIRSLRIVR